MKLTIAVTDANIFIDLLDLDLIDLFFDLDLEIYTTSAVFYELNAEQRRILKAYQSVGKLTVHNLQESDLVLIYQETYPKSLSETDKSVLFIANQLDACVLSSDKVLRNCAKNKGIEYHGMIWIFDRLVEKLLISKNEAMLKLEELVFINFTFRNNPQLKLEIEKRRKLWNNK